MQTVTCRFVPNFLSYVSVEYYLNWFTVNKTYNKNKKGEHFIETQCIIVIVGVRLSGHNTDKVQWDSQPT